MWKPETLIIALSFVIFGTMSYANIIVLTDVMKNTNEEIITIKNDMYNMRRELKQPEETPEKTTIVISINGVSPNQVVSANEPDFLLSEEEIDLIATLTMAEAEGESELGQRLVIDTVLNRMDSLYFPETVKGVIYQTGQFTCIRNGRFKRCYVKQEIKDLVIQELDSRTNSDVAFFTANHYRNYGSPLFTEGHHYFCKDTRS